MWRAPASTSHRQRSATSAASPAMPSDSIAGPTREAARSGSSTDMARWIGAKRQRQAGGGQQVGENEAP